MGIIPAAALDVAATYTADVLSAPLPVAVATVLAVLTVVGLRLLGRLHNRASADKSPLGRLLRPSPLRACAVVLPRLPQRQPRTRTPRPADAPDEAAWGLLLGPPGPDSRSFDAHTGDGPTPR